MTTWKTRIEHRPRELTMKGLLPTDRQILRDLERKLTPPGASGYCLQVAAMNLVDARIMLARTRCKARAALAKTVAVRIDEANSRE